MLQANEVVTFILGLGALVFIWLNYRGLKDFPESGLFIVVLHIIVTSWGLSVIEGIFWESFFNFLEHVCSAIGCILFAFWCWMVFVKKELCS